MDPTVPSPESSQIDVPPMVPDTNVPGPVSSEDPQVPQVPTPMAASDPMMPPPSGPNPVEAGSLAPPPPDMNNVTGMPSSAGATPNKKLIIWVIVGILIIALIGGGAYLLASGKLGGTGQAPTPTPQLQPVATSTPTPAEGAGMEDWNTFSKEGVGFTFMYPPDLEYREYEDGTYSVSKWGPTQKEGSEFYDGISLSFKVGELGGMTMADWVDKKYGELKEVFEVTAPEEVELAGVPAHKMHVKGIIEADYYYLPLGEASYLEIINATKDPTSAGFADTVQKVLSSLKLL